MTKRRSAPVSFKALTDEGTGVFEAIVSVFGNVDYGNDRILPGAFTASLERWKSSGDPIPIIFSHQWDDLDAHVGEVIDAEEWLPGDSRLPAELRANGGLYVKGRLDMEEDFAARLWKKLNKRTIKEFSFAYDVMPDGQARDKSDGANNLTELDLIEVGPTLKGMNPATELLDVKSLEAGAEKAGISKAKFIEALEGAVSAAKAVPTHPYVAGAGESAGRCLICGLTRNTVAHINTLSTDADGAKAYVVLPGSYEDRWADLYEEIDEWARGEFGAELYDVRIEATYPDYVVFQVELWSDPLGGGEFYAAPYTVGPPDPSDPDYNEDVAEGNNDEVTLGEVTPVEVQGVVVAKSARKAAKATRGRKHGATVPPVGHGNVKSASKGQGEKAEEPEDSKTRNESEAGSSGEVTRALTELELLELS